MEKTEVLNGDVKFIVTMDIAFEMLKDGVISAEEYEEFLGKMSTKYKADNLQVLYQFKLDIFRDKRVNTSTKGVDIDENNKIAIG